MTIIPQCTFCKHFIDDGTFSCSAYDYIPDKIITNEVKHNQVLADQKGTDIFIPRMTDNGLKRDKNGKIY